jgi:hypothetical protein
MKEVWELPPDVLLKPTSKEWLLHLLGSLTEMQRAMTLMTLWRIWYAHNELTHGKPAAPIEGSRRFLVGYLNSLLMIKQYPEKDVIKGKMTVSSSQGFRLQQSKSVVDSKQSWKWTKPSAGNAKLNVDGSYGQNGEAGAGMVLRDHDGQVIYAACRHIEHCYDATDAELLAIEEEGTATQLALVNFKVHAGDRLRGSSRDDQRRIAKCVSLCIPSQCNS